MEIRLLRAELKDAERIHRMKCEAFLPLYERYRDDETSPAKESIEKVYRHLQEKNTDYWLIQCGEHIAGAVRVVFDGDSERGSVYRISPFFILPRYQNRGIGQAVLSLLLANYPQAGLWRLSTIKQEGGNCHLYEKCGFSVCGPDKAVNERLTLVFYQREC